MNWRIKGLIQKLLSTVPAGTRINDALQRTFGELRDVDGTIDSKIVDDWVVLALQLRELGVPLAGAQLLEVGTGWFPVFPLCFYLTGTHTCHTYDLDRHLNAELTHRTVRRLSGHLERIADAAGCSAAEVSERYARLRVEDGLDGLLRTAGVVYHAPADAARTGLPDGVIDVAFSNSVLEHVPSAIIGAIFKECTRVLRDTGVAIHSVNCGDHYAYFDKSISFINYLQYNEKAWQFWNNSLLYQNRLRPGDFLELARTAGQEIVMARHQPKAKLLDALRTMQIAPEFSRYSPEDLCATSVDFAARRSALSADGKPLSEPRTPETRKFGASRSLPHHGRAPRGAQLQPRELWQ